MMPRVQPRDLSLSCVSITAESMLLFSVVWPTFEPAVEALAYAITPDRDDREDLVQEAMITLWKSNPSCYDFMDRRDIAYVKRMLINRMIDVWGRHRSGGVRMEDPTTGLPLIALALCGNERGYGAMPASHVRALVAQLQQQ